MIREKFVFGISRAILLGDKSTPPFVKNWFKICDNHDPVELANCAEIFSKVLSDEAKAMGDKHAK